MDKYAKDTLRGLTRAEAIKDYKHLRKVTANLSRNLEDAYHTSLERISMKDYIRREQNRLQRLVDKMLELKLEHVL